MVKDEIDKIYFLIIKIEFYIDQKLSELFYGNDFFMDNLYNEFYIIMTNINNYLIKINL